MTALMATAVLATLLYCSELLIDTAYYVSDYQYEMWQYRVALSCWGPK